MHPFVSLVKIIMLCDHYILGILIIWLDPVFYLDNLAGSDYFYPVPDSVHLFKNDFLTENDLIVCLFRNIYHYFLSIGHGARALSISHFWALK